MTGNRLPFRLADAIDRHGPHLDTWADRKLAGEVKAAAAADPSLAVWLDGAARLDAGLAAARASLDGEIARSAAVGRVAAAALGRYRPMTWNRRTWMAMAAALVLAACLGSLIDLSLGPRIADDRVDVVVLDPLVFGPMEQGLP